jgi:hypothetical protein
VREVDIIDSNLNAILETDIGDFSSKEKVVLAKFDFEIYRETETYATIIA